MKWMLLLPLLLLQILPQLALAQSNPNNNDENSNSKLAVNQFYDYVRQEAGLAGNVTRVAGEGVNLDTFYVEGEGEITLFHFGIVEHCEPDVYLWCFEDLANIQLAISHLNNGDGSVVPQVEGLNERCPVRFTGELRDSLFSGAQAVREVFDMTNNRVPGVDRIPSAFIGDVYSFLTIPMALVTSILGYPQISPGATSPELDARDDYPLFGRSVPSDTGNAVPVVLYMSEFLKLDHLVILNVNDAYGNAYAEAMKQAAAVHAPEMLIRQIPLDDGQASIESAIASVKESEYRFIYCLVFTNEVHDALLTEAYEQGVAGNGLHNWMFADSFWTVLDARSFEKDSALHLAYKGAGMIEISGGVAGIPSYDNFWEKLQELRNPGDFAYLNKLNPHYDPKGNGTWFVDNKFLDQSYNGWSPFAYEATIAFGLAACAAYNDNHTFTGANLYDHFLNVSFRGVVGNFSVLETGSRDSQTAVYSVSNYREVESIDEATGLTMVAWETHTTSLFVEGTWQEKEEYVFNDGTTNIPISIAPPDEIQGVNLTVAIVVPIVAILLIGALVFLFYEHKRKETDSVWKVEKTELQFADPPVIVVSIGFLLLRIEKQSSLALISVLTIRSPFFSVQGSGSFGLVLLAEYRGTQVAVKRAIPPKSGKRDSGMGLDGVDTKSDGMSSHSGLSSGLGLGMKSRASGVGMKSKVSASSGRTSTILGFSGNSNWNKMKQEFIEEMRHLSKLRHPCITTIMYE